VDPRSQPPPADTRRRRTTPAQKSLSPDTALALLLRPAESAIQVGGPHVSEQTNGAQSAFPAGKTAWFAQRFEELTESVESFIRGKSDVVRMALVCMLAEGHLLVEDVPGNGKTSLAKAIAQSIDGSMRRIQFTPDLLPSDVTGVQVYDAGKREFEFRPGPVFANIVLADEINRSSPKTQSALLEVMAERQCTVDGVPYIVPRPFVVIATQNPIEHGGTYALPEAQLDRFMMKMGVGYPDHESEVEVVSHATTGVTTDQIQPVMTTDELAEMIDIVAKVHVAPAVLSYLVTVCAGTRTLPDVRLGVSPRGGVLLAQASQAFAATQGRGFTTADDVKAVAPFILPHRIIMRPEAELQGRTAGELVDGVLTSVPVPQLRVGA
jgi:MoxR-like ATPase